MHTTPLHALPQSSKTKRLSCPPNSHTNSTVHPMTKQPIPTQGLRRSPAGAAEFNSVHEAILRSRGRLVSPIRAPFQKRPLNLQVVTFGQTSDRSQRMRKICKDVLPGFICQYAGCLQLHISACTYSKKHDRQESLKIEKG